MKYAENTEIGLGFGNPIFNQKALEQTGIYKNMYAWLIDSKTEFTAISPNVMDITHKIKLKNDFSPNFLLSLIDGLDETYLLKNVAYRFKRIGDKLHIVRVENMQIKKWLKVQENLDFDNMSKVEKEMLMLGVFGLQKSSFSRYSLKQDWKTNKQFNLDDKLMQLSFDERLHLFNGYHLLIQDNVALDITNNWQLKEEGWDEWILSLIQLIIFVKYGDVNVKLIESNSKSKIDGNKVRNESKHNITIVTENWNTISIRTEGFSVSGHWRLQPCGINNSQRKFKFINPYEKNGYVRKGNGVSKLNTQNI